jgi:hypothetical protein
MLAKGFITYSLSSFATFEDLETACELLAIHEPNYGRFPPYSRFRALLTEHQRTTTGAYQPNTQNALPPAQDRGVEVDRWGQPATNADVERLKTKVACSKYFSTHKTIDWGTRYLREAIAEAEARNIPLAQIGVVEVQAVAA